jgi:hypothetical protein
MRNKFIFLFIFIQNSLAQNWPIYNLNLLRDTQNTLLKGILIGKKNDSAFQHILKIKSGNINRRIDSMYNQLHYTIFLQEKYYPKYQKYSCMQYYFCDACTDSILLNRFTHCSNREFPICQFYDDSMADLWKYYLSSDKAEQNLPSIKKQFANKKLYDKIKVICTYEETNEFCLGGYQKTLRKTQKLMRRIYPGKTKPDYYQIETLLDKTGLHVSFQFPQRTKYIRIIEFHGF